MIISCAIPINAAIRAPDFPSKTKGYEPPNSLPNPNRFPLLASIIARGLDILDKRFQQVPHTPTDPCIGRIIVHRENRHGTLAPSVDDQGLTGQRAVPVDTGVATWRNEGAEREDLGSFVEDRLSDDGPAGHSGLNEWGFHAGAVGEGGKKGVIDAGW